MQAGGSPPSRLGSSRPECSVRRTAAGVDDVAQLPPVDVDGIEAGLPEHAELGFEGEEVPDVVLPAGLLLGTAVAVTVGGDRVAAASTRCQASSTAGLSALTSS